MNTLTNKTTTNAKAGKNELSEREKKAIVYLRTNAVPAKTVADAFGISTQSVAAHLASHTTAIRKATTLVY